MTQALGIRLDEDILSQIDSISREDDDDRSTTIRKMILKGMRERNKEKARDDYIRGKLSLSGAADKAGVTLFDFREYLVSTGFVSSYSVEDLMNETTQLACVKQGKKTKGL